MNPLLQPDESRGSHLPHKGQEFKKGVKGRMPLKRIRGERGSAILWLAIALPVLLGSSGLVVDLGYLYYQRGKLMDIAEASAMAGTMELAEGDEEAIAKAREYAILNGVESDEVTATVTSGSKKVKVKIDRDVSVFFERIFGVKSRQVSGFGGAEIGPPAAMGEEGGGTDDTTEPGDMVPFGIEKQDLVFGELYTLKAGASSGPGEHPGNFGALALGGCGASVYRENINYGYDGILRVGDWIWTEPGNMSGPTTQGVDFRLAGHEDETYDDHPDSSPRIVIAPVLDEFDCSGKCQVQIVGFAAFFLEGVGGQGQNNYVYGRFLHFITEGEIGDGENPYGLSVMEMTDYYEG